MIYWAWLFLPAIIFFFIGAGVMHYKYGKDLDTLKNGLGKAQKNFEELKEKINARSKGS